MVSPAFMEHFSQIPDERQEGKVKHPLVSIFFIAVAAAISSCDDWEETVMWAGERIGWLRKFIDLPYGIPSDSTFERVFRFVDPKQFEKSFMAWASGIVEVGRGETVAIDGKALRGAKSAVHIVSAWLCENGLSLGEVKTDAKSNEITAIPELLRLLYIEGAVVAIDAMGTQTAIAEQNVKENGADYVLALKGNQPSMHADAALLFTGVDLAKEQSAAEAERKIKESAARMPSLVAAAGNGALPPGAPAFLEMDFQTAQTIDKGHGRIERRVYATVGDIGWLSRRDEWANLQSVGIACSITTDIMTGGVSSDTRFYLSSVNDIGQFAKSVRQHWRIESTHWTLDVAFREDKSRIRKDNEPQNMAVIRKLALNYLKLEKKKNPRRESFNVKRKRAMINMAYLERVMAGDSK